MFARGTTYGATPIKSHKSKAGGPSAAPPKSHLLCFAPVRELDEKRMKPIKQCLPDHHSLILFSGSFSYTQN